MNFPQPIPVTEIAEKIGATLIGNTTLDAVGINEIHNVRPGDITFVDVEKYFAKSLNSAATIIILNKETTCPEGKVLLLCDDPFKAYNSLINEYNPRQIINHEIAETANIHPSTIVEPGAVVGPEVRIGKNCYIQANATIQGRVIIGNNVTIESGVVVGTDAFYYKRTPEGYTKWRSGGRVIIEDNVDIGSCSTINIGVSGDTTIGEGTKLDSQIQIGHDAVIGKHCLMAAQSAVAGNTHIGDWTVIYGQCGITQNLRIGERTVILAKSLVTKNLKGGETYSGNPAQPVKKERYQQASLRQLVSWWKDKK